MSATGDAIARESLKHVGAQYEYGGKGPGSFDCSGFVAFVVKRATGMVITPASSAQAQVGKAVQRKDIQPGDILGWDTGGGPWSHTGIYVGDNSMMNCLNTDLDCKESDLGSDYWRNQVQFSGARRLGKDESGGGTTVGELVFGNVPAPRYDIKIVEKPWVGAGYDPVPPRSIVGMCMHKWWGYGDKYSLYRLFSTGGERQADALTDWSLTQEGELVMLNQPWGTRAGWANGPADDLEGDGVLFVRKLGVGAVNSRLESVEFEGMDDLLTAAQMEVGSSLWAWRYDRWEVPWDQYPTHPKLGIVTDIDHWEIGGKECPFKGARSQRSDFQDLVRGKMKAGQTSGSSEPIPPPNPPAPDHDWLPDGLTEAQVKTLFGTLTLHRENGTTEDVPFDAKGIISNAWLSRGAKEKVYPEARDWWRLPDAAGVIRNVVSFSNGWVLFGDTERSSWRWM